MASVAAATGLRMRRLTTSGIVARVAVAGLILTVVLLIPLLLPSFRASQVTLAVIFAVIGLSMNVLTGHLGQISLGHQAFVGVGAFASGLLVTDGLSFYLALPIAGLIGAASAALLGLVALRIGGLYLALITLAYGAVAEESIFNIRALTRGGEGMPAPRPAEFQGDRAYLYLTYIILALILTIDWRLMKSKAGRAILAIRHDERVAATMGVNVTFYKTFAFMLSGFMAGVAGSMFAHWNQVVVSNDFVLDRALVWVFMTVVGGLGSRAGVVIGSAFFALLPFVLESLPVAESIRQALPRAVPLIGAVLLVVTLVLYPGGIGQQLLPLRRWLAGGPFVEHKKEKKKRKAKKAAPTASGPQEMLEPPAEDLPVEEVTAPVPAAPAPDGPSPEAASPPGVGDGQPAAEPKRRLLRRSSRRKGA